MNTLLLDRSPFDILVRNFFQDNSLYHPLRDSKIQHPIDIYQDESGCCLNFEIACTGISKDDIEIQTQDNILRINYSKTKEKEDSNKSYIYKGIAKRSFNLGWKIDSKYNLNEAEASFKDGLLTISIPFSEEKKMKLLAIN